MAAMPTEASRKVHDFTRAAASLRLPPVTRPDAFPGPARWRTVSAAPQPYCEPYLKGRVKYLGQVVGGPQKAEMDYGENMRRFYVRENTGRALEKAAQNGTLRAKVRLWHGEGVIQSVFVVSADSQ